MSQGGGALRPKIIAVANQKGGVGKTTTAVNLASSLAFAGFKSLLVDLDPQGNASSGLGIDRHTSATVYDILIGRKELQDCIQTTSLENLSVIPSNQNLIGAEVELINAISREKKLKMALKKVPQDFDFVLFDCPPSLGLLTINAFTASHSILIPTQCEYYALEGLGQLLNTYQIVKEDLNENLEIEGVLLTMFDPRNKLTHEVVKEMEQHFPDKLLQTRIPRNVKLSESPSFGKPIILYDAASKGCSAYLQLAAEVAQRNGLNTEGFVSAEQRRVARADDQRGSGKKEDAVVVEEIVEPAALETVANVSTESPSVLPDDNFLKPDLVGVENLELEGRV